MWLIGSASPVIQHALSRHIVRLVVTHWYVISGKGLGRSIHVNLPTKYMYIASMTHYCFIQDRDFVRGPVLQTSHRISRRWWRIEDFCGLIKRMLIKGRPSLPQVIVSHRRQGYGDVLAKPQASNLRKRSKCRLETINVNLGMWGDFWKATQ